MRSLLFGVGIGIVFVFSFSHANIKDDLQQLWIDAQLPDFADNAQLHRSEGTRSYVNKDQVVIENEPMHVLYLTFLLNDRPMCLRWEPAKWTDKVPLEPVNAKDWIIDNMTNRRGGTEQCWKGLRKAYGSCTVQSWRLLATRPLYFFPVEKIEIWDPQTGKPFTPKQYKTVLLDHFKVRVGDVPAETTKCIPPALHETVLTDYMPVDWESVEDKTIRDKAARKVGDMASADKIPTGMGVTMTACSCEN